MYTLTHSIQISRWVIIIQKKLTMNIWLRMYTCLRSGLKLCRYKAGNSTDRDLFTQAQPLDRFFYYESHRHMVSPNSQYISSARFILTFLRIQAYSNIYFSVTHCVPGAVKMLVKILIILKVCIKVSVKIIAQRISLITKMYV